MPLGRCDTPSIATVRHRIAELLDRETQSGELRSIVVLAVDGVPFDLARRTWAGATHVRLASVFPTTSATAWLTSLTALDVEAHGMVGVIARLENRGTELIDLVHECGPFDIPVVDNIFSDAARRGYRPLAIAGDLDAYDGRWRDSLLRHADPQAGGQFCADPAAMHDDATAIAGRVEAALRDALRRNRSSAPALVWCFVDLDYIVHLRGYDKFVCDVLAAIDRVACRLASKGNVVVGHSDHGLVPTRNDPDCERVLTRLAEERGFAMGGAGRTRWIYPGTDDPGLHQRLRAELPDSVLVVPRDELFSPGSLAYERIGEIVLIAEGEAFLAPPGYTHDHGSWLHDEVYVPFSTWTADGAFANG